MRATPARTGRTSRRVITLVVSLTALVAPLVLSGPAHAADVVVELGGPKRAHSGTTATLNGTVTPATADQKVTLQRRRSGTWVDAQRSRTNASGGYSFDVSIGLGSNTFRSRVATGGDSVLSRARTVTGVRAAASVSIKGAHHVIDERSLRLSVRWKTADGRALTGKVRIDRRAAGAARWKQGRKVSVRKGTGSFAVAPRQDTYYRAVAPQTSLVRHHGTPKFLVDNRPPGRKVLLPAGAPRPSVKMAPQRRASGTGPNPRIRRIPAHFWRTMTGRSWHRGCPVGRSSLRQLKINYWGFDGYRHRGTLVVNASVARRAQGIFADIYRARLPIRSIIPVDRFGWSKRVHGANDYRSMRADNTSAFNCRSVVGKPSVRSPHALGRSIDVNTWENPYRSARGLVPNAWWDRRHKPHRVTYRSGSHPIVKIFRQHGFSWLGSSDWQHFQYNGSGRRDLDRHEGLFLD